MGYTVAVTNAGQMTIPKILRDKYGITTKVNVEEKDGMIIVQKEKTAKEQLDEALTIIDNLWTEEEKKEFRKHPAMNFEQVVDELGQTTEGRAEIEAEFGKGVYA
ncbi:AbrB/MazE/SpoVT family DNA-binding domain-containing protein [Candidatus Saccharibacteria bacterium]|nr:AbrB/MazE/SpoVT family DNA-binding domain-containing protein [Candidatus Saccharibacteria bacterium]